MKWLLDTSVFSQPLKKSPDQSALERWKKVGDRSCLTSIVVTAEVEWGLLAIGSERLWSGYRQLLEERLEDFGARTRQSQPREGGSERAKCAAPGYRGLSLASRAGPSHGPWARMVIFFSCRPLLFIRDAPYGIKQPVSAAGRWPRSPRLAAPSNSAIGPGRAIREPRSPVASRGRVCH